MYEFVPGPAEQPHMARMLEPSGPDAAALLEWLLDAASKRDLSLDRLPRGDSAAVALTRGFVAGLAREIGAFRAIVDDAVGAVELNAQQLSAITAFATNLQVDVEATATAMAQIDRGAASVADAGEALRVGVGAMTAAMDAYDDAIAALETGFAHLIPTVDATSAFAGAMDAGAGGIATFLGQLQRISRQARLLAINASIEAAHLGEAGHGFVIVAEEVKKLSGSTASSARNVGEIERALVDASAQVTHALQDSMRTLHGLLAEVRAGRERARQNRAELGALAGATGEVAAVAGEQSATLSQIAAAVERVAANTAEIAAATRRAGELDLSAALGRLRQTTATYVIGAVDDSAATVDADGLPLELRAAAAALRAQVDADERNMLEIITRLAVAIARNSYEWKAIAGGLDSLRRHLEETVRSIEQTAVGATGAATAAAGMRRALESLRAGFAVAIDEIGRTLDAVTNVRDQVGGTEQHAVATSAAGERAAAILDIIDTISGDTTLLAINAAIEAAHAGEAGSSFGVIADEIKHLADTTLAATASIGEVLGRVKRAGLEMGYATRDAVAQTATVHDAASQLRGVVAEIRGELDRTLDQTALVARVVEEQQAALGDARGVAEAARKRAAGDAEIATDVRRIELAMLGMRAHSLAAARPLGTTAEEVRVVGLAAALEMDGVFEDALARGAIRLDDCFDTSYQLVTGDRIRSLARLFDVSRVPASGFDPPKFATRYDAAVEGGFNAAIDRSVPLHAAIKAMFAVDLNGYCFGHYHECRQDWTGDYTTDLNHNRIKRFFEDALSLRCSRVGLGAAADSLPARTPYATFRERGCALEFTGERPWAVFTYARDTGIVYNDLSVGLFARGRRVGTIRIIYDADRV